MTQTHLRNGQCVEEVDREPRPHVAPANHRQVDLELARRPPGTVVEPAVEPTLGFMRGRHYVGQAELRGRGGRGGREGEGRIRERNQGLRIEGETRVETM